MAEAQRRTRAVGIGTASKILSSLPMSASATVRLKVDQSRISSSGLD